MTNAVKHRVALLMVAAMLASPMATAQAWPDADYQTGKTRLRAELKLDLGGCERLALAQRKLCSEQARLRHTAARNELRSSFAAQPDRQSRLLAAQARP